MIGLSFLYLVAGLTFLAFALLSAFDAGHPKRFGNAVFYALVALSFLAGDRLGDLGNGVLVLAVVTVAGTGMIGRGPHASTTTREERIAEAEQRGDRLFLPALVVPVVALIGTFAFRFYPDIVDPKQTTLVSLTLGVIIALLACYLWLRPRPATPYQEGRRLMDSVGWAAILPQMLASLGAVFLVAGVGSEVGKLIDAVLPHGSIIGAVIVYGIGMALFTMATGNAFSAFPVMAGAIGVPLLIRQYGGDPAIIAAIGMLAGFCGTLMTPMAANFNLVPAALLELKDRNAVIKAQIGTALPLLGVNIALLYLLGFR